MIFIHQIFVHLFFPVEDKLSSSFVLYLFSDQSLFIELLWSGQQETTASKPKYITFTEQCLLKCKWSSYSIKMVTVWEYCNAFSTTKRLLEFGNQDFYYTFNKPNFISDICLNSWPLNWILLCCFSIHNI